MLKGNLETVRAKISQTCLRAGRDPNGVALVCVTKGIDIDRIKEAVSLGVTDIGENRVQEALAKYYQLTVISYQLRPFKWHLIGHLQKNKARDAVKIFDLIHSVDSRALAEAINKEAEKINKIQEILIQVNVSGEETKFGIDSESALLLAKDITKLPNLKLNGLMTIAPLVDNPGNVRPYFKVLRELRDKIFQSPVTSHQSPVLSMGMSQDYQVAIEEGATMVRIGTAIFRSETRNQSTETR